MKPRTIILHTIEHRTVVIFRRDYEYPASTHIYPDVSPITARRLSFIVRLLQQAGRYTVTPIVSYTGTGWTASPSDKNNNDD